MKNVTLTLKCSKAQHWTEAIFFLFFTLLGGFVPIYLGAFFVKIFGAWTSWEPFFNKGELAIYSATYFASAIFVKVKPKLDYIKYGRTSSDEDNKLKVTMYSIIIPIFGLFFSGAIFASVFFRDFLNIQGFDYHFYNTCSIVLFLLSIISSFLFSIFDIIRINVDPDVLRNIMESELEKKMKKARS